MSTNNICFLWRNVENYPLIIYQILTLPVSLIQFIQISDLELFIHKTALVCSSPLHFQFKFSVGINRNFCVINQTN